METRGVFVDWGLNELKAYIFIVYPDDPESSDKKKKKMIQRSKCQFPWNWSFWQL